VNAANVSTYAGNAHRFICEYNEALACYTEALSLYEQAGMIEKLPVAKTLTGLSWLYYYLGKDKYSLQYFQQALNIVRRLVPFQDHPHFANAHINVAQALYQRGDYDQAMNHTEITMNIERRIFPSKSCRLGTTLLNMGKFLYKQGNYKQALTLDLEAVDIFLMHRNDKDRIKYAFGCNNMGKIHYRTKNYAMAEEYYKKALDCLETLFPNGHIDIAYALKNMSELYLATEELNSNLVKFDKICFQRKINI
jgi:tetratricopeptide (TPR) repeat protein